MNIYGEWQNWRYQNSQNPWTYCHKIWRGWLCKLRDPACQNSDCPSGGVPANGWNITLAWLLVSFVCDSNFCWRLRLNRKTDIYAVWFIGCQSRVIAFLEDKTTKNPNSSIFTPKTPIKRAWIGIFKPNAQNCILSKLLHPFKPNFAQWPKTTKYSSRMVQTGV